VRRRDQRRAAVFAVYQHDLTGTPVADLLEPGASRFTQALATAAAERSGALDEVIDRHAHGWDVGRLAPLDRAILRVAILEMTDPSASGDGTPIPVEGAVDEAVETAKQFCSTDSPGFVNGILGAVIKELGAK
jgi:transcription antitermination protein NusB